MEVAELIKDLDRELVNSAEKYINWEAISNIPTLSEEFLLKYEEYLHWDVVLYNLKDLTQNLIYDRRAKWSIIQWDTIVVDRKIKLDENLLLDILKDVECYIADFLIERIKFSDRFLNNKEAVDYLVETSAFWEHQNLTLDFIKKHEDKIRAHELSCNNNIDWDVYEYYKDRVKWDWYELSGNPNITEEGVLNNIDLLDLNRVSLYSKLSEEFCNSVKAKKEEMYKSKEYLEERMIKEGISHELRYAILERMK